jgi:DNA-binding FadR family transcriptional regulator
VLPAHSSNRPTLVDTTKSSRGWCRKALCESFADSRTVVTEAVKILQEKGLVQIRRGSGTTVTAPVVWNMLVLDDVVVTRRLLESDMANVAAREADDEVVQQLQRLVATMDTLVEDPTAYAEQDRAFHDTIMRTSGNRIARAVVRALEKQVVNTARYVGEIRPDLCVASNNGHRNIYLRIAAHDPDGAAKAMFTHITEAWEVRRGGSGEPVRLRR